MSVLLKLIHELNQPLTVIKAYVGGCILRIKKNELSSEQMLSVMEKINKHAELFENKIQTMQEIIIQEGDDIPSVITETAALFRYELKQNNIELHLEFPETLLDCQIDKSLLKQIVFRILKQCFFSLEEESLRDAEITLEAKRDQKSALRLMVRSSIPVKDRIALDHELTYCRSLLTDNAGTLSVELLPNSTCFIVNIFTQND